MVKIRLARRGRKKLALYDVVVADGRSPRDGRFIEKLGTYNPNTNPATIVLEADRAVRWLMVGAQPTDTANAILRYKGVLYKKHLQVGVAKGAMTQEIADQRYEDYLQSRDARVAAKVEGLSDTKTAARETRLAAESKVRQARQDAIDARDATRRIEEEAVANARAAADRVAAEAAKADQATAPSAEEVTIEATPEAAVEVPAAVEAPAVEVAEVKAPAAESLAEAPATEAVAEAHAVEPVVEAPAAEVAVEAPAAEVAVEAPAAEVAVEAPAAEVAVEAPAATVAEHVSSAEDAAAEAIAEDPASVTLNEAPAADAGEEKAPA